VTRSSSTAAPAVPTADIAVQIAGGCTQRSPADRLCRSSGIVAVQAAEVAAGYAAGAFVPREPFVRLDPRAWQDPLLPQALPPLRAQTIGVLPLSTDLLQRLRQAAGEHVRAGPELDDCIGAACVEIAMFWEVRQPPRRLTVGRNPPGLRTVTRDPITARFVGLHVDSFHEQYDAARQNAGNRLSINIGHEPRYLLFVPRAYRQLSGSRPPGRYDVVAAFLAAHGEQPVMRLRIDPGEAYIAPTENLIHDATSLGRRTEDVHVTGRAVFDPRPT
jgi:hypothetical protein